MQFGELHHLGPGGALDTVAALQLEQALLDQVQAPAGGRGELVDLVGQPPHVPERGRAHALLDGATGPVIRVDGHHGVHVHRAVHPFERLAQVRALIDAGEWATKRSSSSRSRAVVNSGDARRRRTSFVHLGHHPGHVEGRLHGPRLFIGHWPGPRVRSET